MREPTAHGPQMNEKEAQVWLLQLAGMYTGMSRRELARALGRDASSLFPANGNPKLDLLARLAHVLDWPVGVVAETILGARGLGSSDPGDATFAELDGAARTAHAAGEYERMLKLSEQMASQASTADEHGLAALRESGGWDGMGRHMPQMDALRRGLQSGVTDPELRRLLETNMANTHYILGHLFEARSMARAIIDDCAKAGCASRRTRAAHAFGYYVFGNAVRRGLSQRPVDRVACAEEAKQAIESAIGLYDELADEFDHAPWRGIANTCRGALLEVEVEVQSRSPEEALAAISNGVEAHTADDDAPVGDLLESFGWWCIFGCNIAIRHASGRDLQQHLARFAERGNVIARRLGNWSMRERLFTMELMQRRQLNDLAGIEVDWMIDREDIEALIGTMGRFPSFRGTGWQILHEATIVAS